MLHYFDSKEELYTALLRKRDMKDRAGSATSPTWTPARPRAILALMQLPLSIPGLVELFSRMSVDAAILRSPAAWFFLERGPQRARHVHQGLHRARPRGVDVEALAKLIRANGRRRRYVAARPVDRPGGAHVEGAHSACSTATSLRTAASANKPAPLGRS